MCVCFFFFFSSRRRHTRCSRDWSSDVCSSDLAYNKRRGEIFQPLQDDIGKALEVYAKAHNINVIIDGCQERGVDADEKFGVTRDFFNDFNNKFPATASAAAPK